VATVKMFLLQILFGNVACNFVPHLAGKDVTNRRCPNHSPVSRTHSAIFVVARVSSDSSAASGNRERLATI
jgi:hypothetical protein